ncbi:Alcohol dehydrogenase superfamily, zinc-type [Pleurostoma richardsiae]|uniref:Alcohol dehydrogenase superfamily, zinc-type n=1 Tax=Pleurostoma richardsiae TaxID=41990 RepID=A0AA38VES8_9PEZI|nr:Alcohol dehydrogenase superfamily, zinc-type [Pleurostoma richardsiae]
MKAVVFHGAFDVRVEERPKPVITDETDAIVKVDTAGLCGSELHMYRGHQKTKTGHVMGHEFIGVVESVGPRVTKFKPGDKVVSIFAVVCKACWFCQHGFGNRCVNSLAFGTQQLDGGQAEFVRVPFADGTLHYAPTHIDDSLLVMMCDIFPTGYYGAMRAIGFLERPLLPASGAGEQQIGDTSTNGGFVTQSLDEAVFVCLGCGPVGLCALMTAKTKGVKTIYAVDAVDERLEQAKTMGGIPLKLDVDDIPKIINDATGGRGADAVIEVVGNKAALRSAFDLVRSCGVLSSIGFHQADLPFTGLESYSKNLTVSFGRAPISSLFKEALECLEANRDKVATIVSHSLPLADARHGYDIFEKYQARKVVFKP